MNPWKKHMWLLFLYVLDRITAHTEVEYYETIVTKTYNCTSYVLNLDLEWLRFRVNQEVEKSCPTDASFVVTELSQRSTECRIGFRYIPNQGEVMKHAKCAKKVNEILENVTDFAYGTQWGCPETAVSVKVTEYYHLGVHVPSVHTMALSETHAGECYVPSLQWKNPILFQCRMNTYGGYAWVASNPKACELPEFSNPTIKMMNYLKRSPIYCSLRIFLYYGFLLQQKTQLMSRLNAVTKGLTTECQDFKIRWIYQNARVDYHRLIDLLFINLRKFNDHQLPAFRVLSMLKICHKLLASTLMGYFGGTELVFQRTEYFQVLIIPLGRFFTAIRCLDGMSVIPDSVKTAVALVCNDHLKGLEYESFYGMHIVVALLTVWPEDPTKKFQVRINYTLPPFQQPGNYICARFIYDGDILDESSNDGCWEVEAHEFWVLCKCTKPGTFALIQDRMPLGPDTAKYKNKLSQPTTDMMHVAVLLLLSTSCLLHLYIRWSMNGMDLYAGEARNANRLKSFFDVNIQEQLLLITDIGIQLRVIKNPHEYTCPLLGSISHVVKLQTGLLNLLSSVVVFSASKIHNLNILMIKIYASCYLFLVCLATTFYFTIPKHYYTMNCLPRIIVPSLVYPMLITHSVAGVFLILYWTRPPYRNLDEWIGICGNTIFSLALWSSLVTMRKPNTFVSRGVIRLTVLTLFKGIYLAVYHVFLKCSMYGFYWRSLKGSKPGDKIQTPTTANTSTSSINKATSRKQRKLTTSTSSPMLTDSHEGSSISTTEIKSRSR